MGSLRLHRCSAAARRRQPWATLKTGLHNDYVGRPLCGVARYGALAVILRLSRHRHMMIVGLAVVVAGVFASLTMPAATAQDQGRRSSFEYLRITPYTAHRTIRPGVMTETTQYRACTARSAERDCCSFEAQTSDESIRTALLAVGNEGWELVSAAIASEHDRGLTYRFKRQQGAPSTIQ
jgi:hypothetical protein